MNQKTSLKIQDNIMYDLPSSLVVFLVALPLCLGIALASGAPLYAGIITGVIGGVLVASLSGSALSVSGPAAGLTTIVLAAITTLGSFEAFLTAIVLAGIIQLVLGFLKAGAIGNFFPDSVIKGMLAAIGLILVLKQIPHALGYDEDFEGDQSFTQADGENTFTEIFSAIQHIDTGAFLIAAVSLVILILWDRPFLRRFRFFQYFPGALLVVIVGILMNEMYGAYFPELAISGNHLVSLPVASSLDDFFGNFTLPDFSILKNPQVYISAFTIAIVASLETLLSIDAADKLDPYKRITDLNRELKAQGIGNLAAGLIGGLPLTAVIVRSSANVTAGARTKMSAIIHGIWLMLTVLIIPDVLNLIPLACLAAVLLMVGYKLCKPSLFKQAYKKGAAQFVPFVITILAILFTDLLVGIIIGIIVGLFFVLKSNYQRSIFTVNSNGNYLIRLRKDVTFLNKALLKQSLKEIPDGSYVIIDGTRSVFIDNDIIETINDFEQTAGNRNIRVELKKSVKAPHPMFKDYVI
ncbi:MAG TPA: SulP family inorganic anion transporter [Cyclobacteriaceae bacterium]|nr:SulP family inorganic anion transporter [Cyclobacteriaceae bacterium]